MNRGKRRLGLIFEVGALLLGIGLLIYFARGDRGQLDVAREAKVFSVPRSGAAGGGGPGASSPAALLEDTLRELLIGIATGRVTEERRSEVQTGLADLLERFEWGKPQNRMSAAALVVQQMFDQSKQQTLRAELDSRQRLAIRLMARELTRQVMLISTGASAGADAINTVLPPGHERITWNQLGGFPYQEGAALPADVSSLRGRSVGLPGFMLSLGGTDDMHEFILVESLWGCCFGSVPAVNQTVLVRMRTGEVAAYAAGPSLVTGILGVGEEREAGFVTSLYRITDATVTPVPATL